MLTTSHPHSSVSQLQANGTLEFELMQGFCGVVQVNVSLTDDGGAERGGVNVSDVSIFELVVSSGYLEVVVSPAPALEEDSEVLCELAAELQIPCSLILKQSEGIYRVLPGDTHALNIVSRRADALKRNGRSSFNSSLDHQFLSASRTENRTWDRWMLASGTRFDLQDCFSANPLAPSCEVNFTDVDDQGLLFLTLDVVHTDFQDEVFSDQISSSCCW